MVENGVSMFVADALGFVNKIGFAAAPMLFSEVFFIFNVLVSGCGGNVVKTDKSKGCNGAGFNSMGIGIGSLFINCTERSFVCVWGRVIGGSFLMLRFDSKLFFIFNVLDDLGCAGIFLKMDKSKGCNGAVFNSMGIELLFDEFSECFGIGILGCVAGPIIG